MPRWSEVSTVWKTFKELDIRQLAEEAEIPLVLACVGAPGVGKSTLVAALRQDVSGWSAPIGSVMEVGLESARDFPKVRLAILVLDATRNDFTAEARWYTEFENEGRKVLVFCNKMDLPHSDSTIISSFEPWQRAHVASGSALNPESLSREFIPRVMEELKAERLSLARHLPLFRIAVARELINDTSFANASYALGTGFAEIIPALDIPFNVADMIVLSKNQGIMVYKLGLALGLPTRWQAHVAEFGGTVGAGFMWRQVARQLAGLIPIWGIVPKVAVAYAGTFVMGEAILYWYQTGKKASASMMRSMYQVALTRGKQFAKQIMTRRPKQQSPRALTSGLSVASVIEPAKSHAKKVCPHCGRQNVRDAKFCAYCAHILTI